MLWTLCSLWLRRQHSFYQCQYEECRPTPLSGFGLSHTDAVLFAHTFHSIGTPCYHSFSNQVSKHKIHQSISQCLYNIVSFIIARRSKTKQTSSRVAGQVNEQSYRRSVDLVFNNNLSTKVNCGRVLGVARSLTVTLTWLSLVCGRIKKRIHVFIYPWVLQVLCACASSLTVLVHKVGWRMRGIIWVDGGWRVSCKYESKIISRQA